MVEYIYDNPELDPRRSPHWKSLDHRDGDFLIENMEQLICKFKSAVSATEKLDIATWSCVLGYCEALSTHKQVRYSLFPIPIDSLRRLVETDFTLPAVAETHRKTVQTVSNWVWSKVVSKSNAKDEQHANSLYIVLRGSVDGKSIDCFGAALSTVIGMRRLGFDNSVLSLSEDHAYESHTIHPSDGDNATKFCTCEVAIPGNTKSQKSKRAKETAETFQKNSALTPQTSWLYMGMAPIECKTEYMICAAALANLNALIGSSTSTERYSEPLLLVKRDLLWILKDAGHLDSFPFALCELGYCEEHCTSDRGEARFTITALASVSVTAMEGLYHQAISCCIDQYQDKQVYPYCYMGFFHKDGGQEEGEEDRLVASVRYFSQASRVASQYKYEWGDSLQLTKVMTRISEYVVHEILAKNKTPRKWTDKKNAVDVGRWLARFFDNLFLWEELTNEQFLSILKANYKTGIGKAFSLLSCEIRANIFTDDLPLQSKRLKGSLRAALQTKKVAVSDMHLIIIADEGRGRRRKRKDRYD